MIQLKDILICLVQGVGTVHPMFEMSCFSSHPHHCLKPLNVIDLLWSLIATTLAVWTSLKRTILGTSTLFYLVLWRHNYKHGGSLI